MKHSNTPQKKTWQQPEIMLISQGNINGGVNTGFIEHSHHSGKYYIHPKAGGSPFSAGKAAYNQYIHS
ncbi:hypothetical protein ACFGVR_22480 [Mucilaginibacter sp. AW1-3]